MTYDIKFYTNPQHNSLLMKDILTITCLLQRKSPYYAAPPVKETLWKYSISKSAPWHGTQITQVNLDKPLLQFSTWKGHPLWNSIFTLENLSATSDFPKGNPTQAKGIPFYDVKFANPWSKDICTQSSSFTKNPYHNSCFQGKSLRKPLFTKETINAVSI